MEGDEVERTIMLTGRSTYIISLPKSWLRSMGVGKGDKLKLYRRGPNEILITTSMIEPKDSGCKVVEISPKRTQMMRAALSCYIDGCTRIILRAKGKSFLPTHLEDLREFVKRNIIGAEIVSESSKEVVIQVFLGPPEFPFDQALRRVYWIMSNMMNNLLKVLEEECDEELASSIVKSDDDVDRLVYYLSRQLKMSLRSVKVMEETGLTDLKDAVDYGLIVKFLERIADHIVNSARIFMGENHIGRELRTKMVKALKEAKSNFDDAIEALFSLDYERIEDIVERSRKLRWKLKDLINRSTKEERGVLSLLAEHLARVSEYSSDIAEIVMSMALRRTRKK